MLDRQLTLRQDAPLRPHHKRVERINVDLYCHTRHQAKRPSGFDRVMAGFDELPVSARGWTSKGRPLPRRWLDALHVSARDFASQKVTSFGHPPALPRLCEATTAAESASCENSHLCVATIGCLTSIMHKTCSGPLEAAFCSQGGNISGKHGTEMCWHCESKRVRRLSTDGVWCVRMAPRRSSSPRSASAEERAGSSDDHLIPCCMGNRLYRLSHRSTTGR